MKKISEGRKMWVSVMVVFAIYAVIFILFEDYDRRFLKPFDEASDWHLLVFSLLVMAGLGAMLLGYAKQMDKRISREQAEKEGRMRRELTQNIAHELKTPVASILGYTETILNTPGIDEGTRHQFIVRTHLQAQRLTALLQDISILNRMDYAANVLTMERVDVSQLFADIVQETALAFENRKMTLSNSLSQGIIVRGNPSLLYSVFRNLVDNALNYAGQGTVVKVYAVEETDYWHFVFTDNGVGIPPEHLPRIFERFYRIDKGRSRSLGGTGLGLAIVKNAVMLHGGTIIAKPTEGGGLTFEFSIKKLGELRPTQ
jgi:two-component system OmpR family sensor kinase/two-component system phosphate regulon sensor histidine kinase PhoR